MRIRMLLLTTVNALFFLIALSPACAHTKPLGPGDTIGVALDVMNDTLDPAAKLSRELCTAEKEAVVSSAEAHKLAKPEAQQKLDAVIEHCNVLRLSFDRMRALHDEARRLALEGQLDNAKAKLGELREAWRGLGASAGGPS